MRKSVILLSALLIFISTLVVGELLHFRLAGNLALLSLIAVLLILLFYYARFEEEHSDSKTIATIAALSALSIAGRVIFAPIPSVQPSTFIIILSGYVFGPLHGFMVGSTTALVSNFFLGHGPWTPWQMLAWGLSGLSAGLLARRRLLESKIAFSIFCAAWGFFFGWIMNAYFLLGYVHPLSFRSVTATYAASFWFDTFHSAGNFLFAYLFGTRAVNVLRRFRERFFFEEIKVQSPIAQGDKSCEEV